MLHEWPVGTPDGRVADRANGGCRRQIGSHTDGRPQMWHHVCRLEGSSRNHPRASGSGRDARRQGCERCRCQRAFGTRRGHRDRAAPSELPRPGLLDPTSDEWPFMPLGSSQKGKPMPCCGIELSTPDESQEQGNNARGSLQLSRSHRDDHVQGGAEQLPQRRWAPDRGSISNRLPSKVIEPTYRPRASVPSYKRLAIGSGSSTAEPNRTT